MSSGISGRARLALAAGLLVCVGFPWDLRPQSASTPPRTYDDYLSALGARESNNNYASRNQFGYLGRFQFGEMALTDCRLYQGDTTPNTNDWIGPWTRESQARGVNSAADFLAGHAFQDFAILRFHELQWASVVRLDLVQYDGTTMGGVHITKSGMLGGAHLVGPGALRQFLASNGRIVPRDGNGVPITDYISQFAYYDVPFH